MIQRKKIDSIQILRGIAALMVLTFHLFPQYQAMGGKIEIFQNISEWGFIGVDIFFVISGYIIAYTTFSQPHTVKNAFIYLKNRLLRIYLGYWPFFAFMFFSLLLFTDNLQHKDILRSFFLTTSHIDKLILPVSWTLSYELYFYFLFFIFFLFKKETLKFLIPSFVVLLIILIYASYIGHNIPKSFFYSPFLLEFFSGVLLFMIHQKAMRFWYIPINLLFIYILLSQAPMPYHGGKELLRILYFGTSAFLFVFTLLILGEYFDLKKHMRFLYKIGDASYTLYLSHTIIMIGFYYVGIRKMFTHASNEFFPITGSLLMLVSSIIFSLVYYEKVEKPLYMKAKSWHCEKCANLLGTICRCFRNLK